MMCALVEINKVRLPVAVAPFDLPASTLYIAPNRNPARKETDCYDD